MRFSSFSVVKYANIPIKTKKPVFALYLSLKGEPQLARMAAKHADAMAVPKKTLLAVVKTQNFVHNKNIQKSSKKKVLKQEMDVAENA